MDYIRDLRIWYVSKYAVSPKYNNAYRQYFFSKNFAVRGYQTTLISSRSAALFAPCDIKGLYKKDTEGNLSHIILNGPSINYGFSLKRLISWVIFEFNLLLFSLCRKRVERPDVMIVSSLSILTFLSGIILKKFFRCKLIIEVRDVYPRTLIEVGKFSENNPVVILLSFVEKLGYKYADAFVSTLPNFRAHLIQVMPSCTSKPFSYIPMGCDDELLNQHPVNSAPSASNPSESDLFIVGYAGTVGAANSVETIIDAARLVMQRSSRIHFSILGDGPELEAMKVRANGVYNIRFLGKVEKKRVHHFVNQCDVLVNPWKDLSIYALGVSPNKWIDYMFAAKPVVVAYSGFRCIVNEAGCGYFVDAENPQALADEIIRLSTVSKKELASVGERGRKYLLDNLLYSKLTDKYLSLIRSI